MVGELDVATADHNATIQFQEDHAVVRFNDFGSAKSFLRQPFPGLEPVNKALSWLEFGLKAKVGRFKAVSVLPDPSWIVRLLHPQIRQAAKALRADVNE